MSRWETGKEPVPKREHDYRGFNLIARQYNSVLKSS